VDPDAPIVGAEQAGADLEGCRLARAVGADEAKERPLFNVEIQIGDG
jgi:hypothetical protein